MRSITLEKFARDLHFKKVTGDDLKNEGSFSLVDEGGTVIGFFMVPASGEKRNQLESLGSQMNVSLGIE